MKTRFRGEITSIQPRIRLARSYDQRQHMYLGYALVLRGTVAEATRDFSVGIGPGAQDRLSLQAGDALEGEAEAVADARLEPVEFYKASRLKVLQRGTPAADTPPPWRGVPPSLETYRARGHRRLDETVYGQEACRNCIWGSRMPVDISLDPWKPALREYRFETFCYGPKSCPIYRPGPLRRVPGRNNAVWTEEDSVDEEATAQRGPDE